MPIASSSYWTMVHGNTPEEVEEDKEGLMTVRNATRNLVWLMECIDIGKKNGVEPPKNESGIRTNFVR